MELLPPFDQLHSHTGRPSIAPEKFLQALLLRVLYTIRSEQLLMEQLDYKVLFRWFVGLNMDDPIWDRSTFSKNRERLLEGDVADAFFDQVLAQARERNLLSDEYFTVDGTPIEAWAKQKRYKHKTPETPPSPPDDPGNPSIGFRGGAHQREPCLDHRSRGAPVQEDHDAGSHSGLLGVYAHRESASLVVDTRVTQATGDCRSGSPPGHSRSRPRPAPDYPGG